MSIIEKIPSVFTQELTTHEGRRFLLGAHRDGVHLWSVRVVNTFDVIERTACGLNAAPDRDVREEDFVCEQCEAELFKVLSVGGMTS